MNGIRDLMRRALPLCVAAAVCMSVLLSGAGTARAAGDEVDISKVSVKVSLLDNAASFAVPAKYKDPADAADKFQISIIGQGASSPETAGGTGLTLTNHTGTFTATTFETYDGGREVDLNVSAGVLGDNPFTTESVIEDPSGVLNPQKGVGVYTLTFPADYDAAIARTLTVGVRYNRPAFTITGGGTAYVVKQAGTVISAGASTENTSSIYYFAPSNDAITIEPVEPDKNAITSATLRITDSSGVTTQHVITAVANVLTIPYSRSTPTSYSRLTNNMELTVNTAQIGSNNEIEIYNHLNFASSLNTAFDITDASKNSVLPGTVSLLNESSYTTKNSTAPIALVNGTYYVKVSKAGDYVFQEATNEGKLVTSGITEDSGFYYIPVTLSNNRVRVDVYGYYKATSNNETIKLQAKVSNATSDTSKQFTFRIRNASNGTMHFENIPVTTNVTSWVEKQNLPSDTYTVGVKMESGYTLESIKVGGNSLTVSSDGDWRYVSVPAASSQEVVATFKREAYLSIKIKKVIANNAANNNTSFAFHIRDKDGRSLTPAKDNMSITGNADFTEYKLEQPGDYRVYEVTKSGYVVTGATVNGSSVSVNTDGNDKYVLVTLSDSNQSASVVFSNTQDNVTTGFTLIPNINKAKTGDAVNYTITGFGNPSGQTVSNYVLDIQIPAGLVFHQLTLPVFRNSTVGYNPPSGMAASFFRAYASLYARLANGLGYDLKYNTNLNGNFLVLRGNLNSYLSYIVDSPASLQYNEQIRTLRIEIPSAPAGFAIGDTIMLNCIVANDAPSSMEMKGNVTYRLSDGTLVSVSNDAAPAGPLLLSTDTATTAPTTGGTGGTGGTVDIVATGEPLPVAVYIITAVLAVAGIAMVALALMIGRRRAKH